MRPPIRELEARLIQAKSAAECLGALLDLADAHAAEFRNLEGLRKAREALNIARTHRDPVSIGRALAAATLCHYQRGDYLSAIATGLDAVDACTEADPAGRSSALQSLALSLHCVKSTDLAQSTATQAVADAKRAKDVLREASARSVLGAVLSDRGAHKQARREFRGAAAAYRRAGDTHRMLKATSNIGHAYRHHAEALATAGQNAVAKFQWKQARRIYDIVLGLAPPPADHAIALGAIAECECRIGNLDAAQAAIDAALALGVDTPAIKAPCHLWHARILIALGDLKGAERAAEEACIAAQKLEHGDVLASCLQLLSTLNDKQGRFETAQDLERRAQEVTLEREAALAAIRTQLAAVWELDALPRGRGQARAA